MLKILKIAALQYLKENVKHEVGFLPPDKHRRLLQIGSIILVVGCQGCPNYSKKKNKKNAISLQYFKRELSHEVNFLHANKLERLFETDTVKGDSLAFAKFPKQHVCNVFTIPQKRN